MRAVPKLKLTVEEYLARERLAPFKSEFHNGEAFAMAGASREHNRIAENISGEFHQRLKGTGCQSFSRDLRVWIEASNMFCYPDFLIVCGEPNFSSIDPDSLTNPRVIIEVLSPSTERYDRIGKFRHYRLLASFREYLLVAQTEPAIEHFTKRDDGTWSIDILFGLDETLRLHSLPLEVPLRDICAEVSFTSPTTDQRSGSTIG